MITVDILVSYSGQGQHIQHIGERSYKTNPIDLRRPLVAVINLGQQRTAAPLSLDHDMNGSDASGSGTSSSDHENTFSRQPTEQADCMSSLSSTG